MPLPLPMKRGTPSEGAVSAQNQEPPPTKRRTKSAKLADISSMKALLVQRQKETDSLLEQQTEKDKRQAEREQHRHEEVLSRLDNLTNAMNNLANAITRTYIN